MSSLKEEVKEIVEIVALVPEAQKTMCFELLLKEALAKRTPSTRRTPSSETTMPEVKPPASPEANPPTETAPLAGTQPRVNDGADIVQSDLHIKVRKFMDKGEVNIAQMNELFYKEGDNFESLSVDLKVSKMSETQVRIALLQALQNALDTGDFETTVEAVREECKARKSYDSANFATILKNAADFFDFGTWSKEVSTLRLSEQGKKELASVVKLVS
jgi:hypothetical protein